MAEIDLTPITRLEYDIDAILNDHAVAEPITRIELILADIVAGNTTTVEPVTRIETYLAIISGADYPVPEPVTRIETFLAIIAGEDYEEPEAVTRLEGLLAEWVEKGSGIWKTVTGTLIHITDALASPMQKCEVSLEPIQDLHGQDAPYPAGGGVNIFDPDNFEQFIVTNPDLQMNGHKYTEAGTYSLHAYGEHTDGAYIYGRVKDTDDSWGSIIYIVTNRTASSNASVTITDGQELYVYDAQEHTTQFSSSLFNGWKVQVAKSNSQPSEYHPYSNICPITGWTGCEVNVDGANLFDNAKVLPSTRIDGGKVGAHNSYNLFVVPVKENTTYTFNHPVPVEGYPIFGLSSEYPAIGTDVYYQTNIKNIIPQTFNSHEYKYALFAVYKTAGNDFSVAVGTDAIPVDTPYQGTTLSVTFPDTVYGGKYEFVGGSGQSSYMKIVVDENTPIAFYAGGFYLTNSWQDALYTENADANKFAPLIVCDTFKYDASVTTGGTGFRLTRVSSAFSPIMFVPSVTSKAEAQAWLADNNVTFLYPVANPVEISLTPQEISTLKGENNVWGSGDIELTYKAQA